MIDAHKTHRLILAYEDRQVTTVCEFDCPDLTLPCKYIYRRIESSSKNIKQQIREAAMLGLSYGDGNNIECKEAALREIYKLANQ